MHDDPTQGLERLNEDEDSRLERRALTDAEVEQLYATTYQTRRVFRRLAGPERAMLYLVALRTGLRRGELRSLTPGSFDFAAVVPSVTLRASISKRRRNDTLPLSPETARMLQQLMVGRSPTELIWPGSWWRQAAKMLHKDLMEAGITAFDDDGRVVDFHALRTTFITSLARAGVPPAMAQRLARHSDINLTLGTYTKLQTQELADAVGRLATITCPSAMHWPPLSTAS
jgi:integrase